MTELTTHSPSTVQQPAQHAWDRWGWIWSAIFLLALIFSTLLALSEAGQTAVSRTVILLLVVASAVWHIFFALWLPYRQKTPLRDNFRTAALFLIVSVLLMLLLLWLDAGFMFAMGTFYGLFFFLLPISWAFPAALLLTFSWNLTLQLRGNAFSLLSFSLWGSMGLTAIAALIATWIERIIRESAERQELLAALQQAQAELAESERRAGVLAERQRLAHELHDTLAQGFIGIVMRLETAVSHLPPEAEPAVVEIEKAVAEARHNLTQVRRVVQNLRPASLEQISLPEAVAAEVEKWQEASGVTAKSAVTGTIKPLSADHQHVLLRVVQESLANVRKHAQAAEVQVTLSYFDDVVLLDVSDNGVGLAETAVAEDQWQGGYGLTAMRERVLQAGGTLTIESEPGEGVTVAVSLPVARHP